MATLQKISPNLCFDTQAEAAAEFYTGIFPNSKVDRIARYPEAGEEIHKMTPGSIMTVDFELDGQSFVALNAGPVFKFNEAISFIVHCDTQQEVDDFWEKLGEGGDPNSRQCGWLKDKYGVSWQVVPTALTELLRDADRERAGQVMRRMLQMSKIDVAELQAAYAQ